MRDDDQLTARLRIERESEISPGTVPPIPPPKDPSHKPKKNQKWDSPHPTDFSRDYRKQLAVLETSGSRIPSISRNPPTATSPIPPSWAGANGSGGLPASVMSFFNDSNEDVAQLSPGFRPGSGKEDSMGFPDARRPSVASQTTVSSSGSKSSISRGFHKKLQGFFGEEFPGDSRQNSDTSLATPYAETQSMRDSRNRTNSVNNTLGSSLNSRPGSPVGSRPRTPLPSSEVTPWEFQDVSKVSRFEQPGAVWSTVTSESLLSALLPSPAKHTSHKILLPDYNKKVTNTPHRKLHHRVKMVVHLLSSIPANPARARIN